MVSLPEAKPNDRMGIWHGGVSELGQEVHLGSRRPAQLSADRRSEEGPAAPALYDRMAKSGPCRDLAAHVHHATVDLMVAATDSSGLVITGFLVSGGLLGIPILVPRDSAYLAEPPAR